MRWATRAGVHIDRAACAWLIRRHVDARAVFVFVDDPAAVPAEATPFDMRGVELGHHGGDCTFETILRRYELADPVLRGLSMLFDDEQVLELTGPMFDGLYEYHRRGLLLDRPPA